jgi:hypothetical protein
MTDTATPRRKRRTAEPDVPLKPVVTTGSPQDALATLLEYLRNIERTRTYRLIGRLSRVQILRPEGVKVLDFRKEGPVLAFAIGTEQLIVTDPWRGIPAKWSESDELCQACLSDCDVCGATGKKLCEAFRCGGGGRVPIPAVPCPAEDCLGGGVGDTINPRCSTCRGSGMFYGTKECEVCDGTGRAKCSLCRGAGRRPTGILGGSTNYREPTCPECGGSKFAHKEIPQDINSFVNARIGDMVALGPIVRFAVESVGGTGNPTLIYEVDADVNGQHLVLLLERETPRAHAYMIGGVLRTRTR